MQLEVPVPSIESSAPLFGLGVWENATAVLSRISAAQQISFITMPLELFTFINLPSIFLGCLLGGRPIFSLQKSESKFHLCAIKFPGKRWPRSLKLQTNSTNAPKSFQYQPPASSK